MERYCKSVTWLRSCDRHVFVQITCYYNRVWLYIISTNTKMFKNPKWITFDILGLCNQLLATHQTTWHSTVQQSSTGYDRDRPYTIIVENFQLRVYDPKSIEQLNLELIFTSKIANKDRVQRSCIVSFSDMIVEKDVLDRLCQMVQIGPKMVRRWTEGGRDYGDFGDDAKMWVVLLVSWLWVMSYFKVNNKFHFGLKLKRNRGPNSGQPRLTVTGTAKRARFTRCNDH